MKNKKYFIALLPFLIVIALFEILPIVSIVIKSVSLRGGGGFTLEHFIRIFTKDLYLKSIINSLIIATASALIGLVIAFWSKSGTFKQFTSKRILCTFIKYYI